MKSIHNRLFAASVLCATQMVAADIARELRAHPERWTKGFNARNSFGLDCDVHDDDAKCWCLRGHILKRNATFSCAAFRAAFGRGTPSFAVTPSFAEWNDAEERTVEDVIALCTMVSEILRGVEAAFKQSSLTTLWFTDEIIIDTSGEYRTLELYDGWYVVGHGSLIPCDGQNEALTIRDELKTEFAKT